MSKIKLCCLLNPIGATTGIMKLFADEKLRKPVICKQCYDNLLDGIPNDIRNIESKGVWEAMTDYVHLKIKQEHLNDS